MCVVVISRSWLKLREVSILSFSTCIGLEVSQERRCEGALEQLWLCSIYQLP